MSHQVKQVGKVNITDLSLFRRAVNAIPQDRLHLPFRITLNEDQKTAYYYVGRTDSCDMVITADREVTDAERGSFYDIAVKIQEAKDRSGNPISEFTLWADTYGSDRHMQERINLIMQRYLVEKRRAEHLEQGAVEVTETVNDLGQVAVTGVYMKED